MSYKLKVDMNIDNDAFVNDDGTLNCEEIRQIFVHLSSRISGLCMHHGDDAMLSIIDINGNKVGKLNIGESGERE